MPKKSSIAVLVSGGLDSAVLLAQSTLSYRQVWPIYVQQGLQWERIELYWLRRFLAALDDDGVQALTVFSLPMADVYGSHWSTGSGHVPGARSKDSAVYLPGRNMILSVKAAVFAAMNRIPVMALGSLDHNPFPDATPTFFKQWGKTLSRGLGQPIQVIAPYRHKSKAEVIRLGKQWPLHLSFSCIAPNGKTHCGRCNKCAERQNAFKLSGVEDLTRYAKN